MCCCGCGEDTERQQSEERDEYAMTIHNMNTTCCRFDHPHSVCVAVAFAEGCQQNGMRQYMYVTRDETTCRHRLEIFRPTDRPTSSACTGSVAHLIGYVHLPKLNNFLWIAYAGQLGVGTQNLYEINSLENNG